MIFIVQIIVKLGHYETNVTREINEVRYHVMGQMSGNIKGSKIEVEHKYI